MESDISVICGPNKLTDRGCTGAPDWIVEIISLSNSSHDYLGVTVQVQVPQAGLFIRGSCYTDAIEFIGKYQTGLVPYGSQPDFRLKKFEFLSLCFSKVKNQKKAAIAEA